MSEQWAEGPELTVNVGMTDEEIRATAVMAAAHAWAGISRFAPSLTPTRRVAPSLTPTRDEAMVQTAVKFAAFIRGETP